VKQSAERNNDKGTSEEEKQRSGKQRKN